MASIALVTSHHPLLVNDRDSEELAQAVRGRGIEVARPAWDDDVDWSSFDLVVIRTPWDYPDRPDEFRAWLAHLDPTRTQNAPHLIEWNLDKRHLLDLQRLGVDIIETIACHNADEVAAAVAAHGTERIVVKPHIGAASRGVGLFEAHDPALLAGASSLLADGMVALVQPGVPELGSFGEVALVYLGGEFSHAFHKGPLLRVGGGRLVSATYTEQLEAWQPTDAERALGDRTMAALTDVARGQRPDLDPTPLVARIDIVTTEAWGTVLVEAEAFEPNINARFGDRVAERFADVVEQAVVGSAA